MKRYLYLSVTPEALISSMLPPEEFGKYQAVGTKKRTRGQAVFFEVDQDKIGDYVSREYIERRCVPHQDGTPKRSVYLSIYRVMETIPLESLKSLYLTTDDGRVLELQQASYQKTRENHLHLYQELSPVTVRVASILEPYDFLLRVTDTSHHVSLPRLFFVELDLNGLAEDPVEGTSENLPYSNIPHLRDCLIGLTNQHDKLTKTVIRMFKGEILYRTCKNGFFVGDQKTILYYPFPSREELESKYYVWWRSALTLGF
ncbi:MAG: hypothetical protein ACNS62_24100 [Candidatus Cyclobacteriaceae bacterium M3_2C_046]